MRILLTGKNGQLGAKLAVLLPSLGEVVAFDRHELDFLNPDHVRRAIRDVQPNLIVNAAAYTSVDQAEREEKQVRIVNVDAPALMAEEAKRIGALLVHYSTDYVFDGSSSAPYVETDQPNPINVYGKTKLAGEEAIRALGAPHLIIRTSWVYGTTGRNFLLTILRLATEREELKIVDDQFGAPTWSQEIAAATAKVLQQLSQQGREAISRFGGTYHMTAGGKASWYEFAKAIVEEASRMARGIPWFETATKGQALVAHRITAIPTEAYPTPARRPSYSVLSNSHLMQDFGLTLPSWFLQLRAVFAQDRVDE